jgi:hypothetical protein
VLDDLHKIADALAVPVVWLIGLTVGGFILLVSAGAAHSRPLGFASVAVGLVLMGVGLRAIVRPSEPFDVRSLRQHAGIDYLNSSRRLGGFYVLAGVAWAFIALLASGPA